MTEDLISRAAALALAKDICVPCKDHTAHRHRCIGLQLLMELPIVQPEIIRCKDCKHFNSYFVECDHENGLKHIKDDHDYCCRAERKQDE